MTRGPIHREYEQGKTTKQTYTDSGQKWDWANSNYMYGRFDVTSEEYESRDDANDAVEAEEVEEAPSPNLSPATGGEE